MREFGFVIKRLPQTLWNFTWSWAQNVPGIAASDPVPGKDRPLSQSLQSCLAGASAAHPQTSSPRDCQAVH